MSAEHDALRESLGALALGQLDPAEEQALRRHVAGCQACTADLAELLPAAAVLREARSGLPGAPPAWVEDRLFAGVDAERRRTRRSGALRRLAAAAVLVVALLGAGVTGAALRGGGGAAPALPAAAPREPVPVVVRQAGVVARAALITHTWGTELVLTATGVPKGTYQVTLMDASGTAVAAGSFLGTDARELRCNLNAGLVRAAAASAVVVDDAGRVVLTADLA